MKLLNSQQEKSSNSLPFAVENFDRMPNSARFGLSTLEIITGKSSATIYRWVNEGKLPKPTKLGNSHNSWSVGEIRAALGIKAQGESA